MLCSVCDKELTLPIVKVDDEWVHFDCAPEPYDDGCDCNHPQCVYERES